MKWVVALGQLRTTILEGVAWTNKVNYILISKNNENHLMKVFIRLTSYEKKDHLGKKIRQNDFSPSVAPELQRYTVSMDGYPFSYQTPLFQRSLFK